MYANFIWATAAIGTCMPVAAVTASTHRCCYSLATQYILYYIVSMLICNISGGDRATWKLRGSLSYYPFKVCLDSSHVNSQPLGRLRVIGSLTSWFTLASPPGNVTLKGNDKRVSVSQVVPKLSAPGLSARLLNVYVVCTTQAVRVLQYIVWAIFESSLSPDQQNHAYGICESK